MLANLRAPIRQAVAEQQRAYGLARKLKDVVQEMSEKSTMQMAKNSTKASQPPAFSHVWLQHQFEQEVAKKLNKPSLKFGF